MSHDKYITVNDDIDYWCGSTPPDEFDSAAEASKIQSAAEAAGIPVIRDSMSRRQQYSDDGEELVEIDWFSEWCAAGYAWDEERWTEWFAKRVPASAN